MQTIILNADFTYLNIVSWQKAIKLLLLGKAEPIKVSEKVINNCNKSYVIKMPLILKLVRMVNNVYKNKVPYSRKNVYARDDFTCQYCGNKENLSIDHILPASRGGKTNFENCVTSCIKCNTKLKGNKTPGEANMRLKKIPHTPTVMEFLSLKMKNTSIYNFLKESNIY